MKKQSASTIKIFCIDDINKRNTIKNLKAALIGIGLKYRPENQDKKTPPQKRGCIKSF